MQHTCNITLRGIPKTTAAVEKQQVLHMSVCARTHLCVRARVCACTCVALITQHAMHHHIASLASPHFWYYLKNGTIFEKKVTKHKRCILIFSTTFIWNISYSKKNSVRYCHKWENVFMSSICYSWQILMKFEFFQQIFKKSSDIKFHQNLSCWSRVVPCG